MLDLSPMNTDAGMREAYPGWVLANLQPAPEEEWERLKAFLGFTPVEREAMLQTVEVLFRRGHELVVGNYDYLLQNHETAAILGWEQGADPEHLAERRRFFTTWLARTLGMDESHDFARYLFWAGQKHAGHGPRRVHVPEVYVIGAASLVTGTFARFLYEEMQSAPELPLALAGWNKTLSLHLHMMLLGYRSARDLEQGELELPVAFFGRLRALAKTSQMALHLNPGQSVEAALRKLFNYYPFLREVVCDTTWEAGERVDENGKPWLVVEPAYRVRPGWRLLVNGREVVYNGGLERILQAGDELQLFPPGR